MKTKVTNTKKKCWVIVESVYTDSDELSAMKEELAMFLEGLGVPACYCDVLLTPPRGWNGG